MKKAKLMLCALLVVALFSTITAFKVNKVASHYLYTGPLGGGRCTVLVIGAAIVSGPPNVAASTTALNSGCPNVLTIAIED